MKGTGMIVSGTEVFWSQIGMGIQLKNTQVGVGLSKSLNDPDADRMLPSKKSGKFPVGKQVPGLFQNREVKSFG
jgi:hypothetical protein